MSLRQTISEAPSRTRSREPREVCHATGCENPTNGRKPFCIEHLDHHPYVRALVAELARRERAEPGADDVLEHLETHGTTTLGRLAREVRLPVRELEPHVTALERAGVVETQRITTRHGHVVRTVKLAPGGLARRAG